jgi:hypothetical protein
VQLISIVLAGPHENQNAAARQPQIIAPNLTQLDGWQQSE